MVSPVMKFCLLEESRDEDCLRALWFPRAQEPSFERSVKHEGPDVPVQVLGVSRSQNHLLGKRNNF